MKTDILPYEEEAKDLLHRLKKRFNDKETILVLLSCVIDYKDDVLEFLNYINANPKVSKDDIVFKAFEISENREG